MNWYIVNVDNININVLITWYDDIRCKNRRINCQNIKDIEIVKLIG